MDYRKREAAYKAAVRALEELQEAVHEFCDDAIGWQIIDLKQKLEGLRDDSRLKHNQRLSDLTRDCVHAKQAARVLRDAGQPWSEIADQLGVSIFTARSWALDQDRPKQALSVRAQNVIAFVVGWRGGEMPHPDLVKQHIEEILAQPNCGKKTRAELLAYIEPLKDLP